MIIDCNGSYLCHSSIAGTEAQRRATDAWQTNPNKQPECMAILDGLHIESNVKDGEKPWSIPTLYDVINYMNTRSYGIRC